MSKNLVDEKKTNKIVDKIRQLLNKYNLNLLEIIEIYAVLGYNIGASLAGYTDQGPDNLEELEKKYYSNPTVDVGLMIQGLLMRTWKEDYLQKPHLSNLASSLENQKKEGKENE